MPKADENEAFGILRMKLILSDVLIYFYIYSITINKLPDYIRIAGRKCMRNIVGYIQKFENNFSKAERKIAKFVIEHPEAISSASVEDMAQLTGTSGATVVRFCRTIGFRGYMDFKYQMERDVLYVMENEQLIMRGDSISSIKSKIIQYSVKLLEEFQSALDDEEMERACDALVRANRVMIFAEGGSASMADYAKTSLVHTGVYCSVETDSSMQIMAAEYAGEGDLVIGMTHSGRIANTIEALALAHKRGATTIAVTGTHGTPVCEHADIVLACDINHQFDLSDFQGSRLEEFCTLSILQIGALMRTYEKSSEIAKRVSDSVELRRVPREK